MVKHRIRSFYVCSCMVHALTSDLNYSYIYILYMYLTSMGTWPTLILRRPSLLPVLQIISRPISRLRDKTSVHGIRLVLLDLISGDMLPYTGMI